ncbi:hypothetical protein F5Y12DRAFT_608031 [Xylaria sp. FL1777]|nr:hypothetical protein F5Y12DRAFT_608031 [Xylaria sp. FL1777]
MKNNYIHLIDGMVRPFSTLGMKVSGTLVGGIYVAYFSDCYFERNSGNGLIKAKDDSLINAISAENDGSIYTENVANIDFEGSLSKTLSYLAKCLKNDKLDYSEGYLELSKLLYIIRDINAKGFINDMNLMNYPLINEFIYSHVLKDLKYLEDEKLFYDKEVKGTTTLLGNKIILIKDAKDIYR